MEAPRFYEAIRAMTRAWFMHVKNARSVFRRAGVRTAISVPSAASPILSLPGTKVFAISCSVELQALIDAFHADPSDANRQALIDYLEDALGGTLEDVFADEWDEVEATGETQRIRVEIGSDIVEIVLEAYGATTIPGGYEVDLEGTYNFDITSQDFSHADQSQAWTTGTNALATAYASTVGQSFSVHLGQGQGAHVSAFSGIVGDAKAWRKNPRRIVDVDPITVTVPASPTSLNPVRAHLSFTAATPQHGEWARFYDGGFATPSIPDTDPGDDIIISELGPPVSFGLLLRSDAQVAAGHPLTDWWFAASSTSPGPVDSLVRREAAAGIFGRVDNTLSVSSSDSELDAAFDDFHDDIVAAQSGSEFYTDPTGLTQTLTVNPAFRGWACLYWWHPTEDWYWKVPTISGTSSTSGTRNGAPYTRLYNLNHTDGTVSTGDIGAWSALTFRQHMNLIKVSPPSGPADEPLVYTYPGNLTQPVTHRQPSLLGRGPWVRISPGETPDSGVRLADASCYVSRPHPEWP